LYLTNRTCLVLKKI